MHLNKYLIKEDTKIGWQRAIAFGMNCEATLIPLYIVTSKKTDDTKIHRECRDGDVPQCWGSGNCEITLENELGRFQKWVSPSRTQPFYPEYFPQRRASFYFSKDSGILFTETLFIIKAHTKNNPNDHQQVKGFLKIDILYNRTLLREKCVHTVKNDWCSIMNRLQNSSSGWQEADRVILCDAAYVNFEKMCTSLWWPGTDQQLQSRKRL